MPGNLPFTPTGGPTEEEGVGLPPPTKPCPGKLDDRPPGGSGDIEGSEVAAVITQFWSLFPFFLLNCVCCGLSLGF